MYLNIRCLNNVLYKHPNHIKNISITRTPETYTNCTINMLTKCIDIYYIYRLLFVPKHVYILGIKVITGCMSLREHLILQNVNMFP